MWIQPNVESVLFIDLCKTQKILDDFLSAPLSSSGDDTLVHIGYFVFVWVRVRAGGGRDDEWLGSATNNLVIRIRILRVGTFRLDLCAFRGIVGGLFLFLHKPNFFLLVWLRLGRFLNIDQLFHLLPIILNRVKE